MPLTTAGCAVHPDRAGSVICRFCGQSMCASCLHQDEGGPLCPVCVRYCSDGTRRTEVVKVKRSERPSERRSYRPVMTSLLVLVCLAVFSYDWWTLGDLVMTNSERQIWQVPEGGLGDWTLYRPRLAEQGEWYRVFSSGFVHFNLVHLLINMVALWALGSVIERSYGALTLATMFAAGVVGGSLGAVIVESDVQVGGASGAIFALLGAIAMLQLVAGRNVLMVSVVLAINVGLSFLPFVAVGGHMGGLAVGAIAGLILGLCRRSGPRAVAFAPTMLAGLGVAVFLVLAQVVAPGALPLT